MRYFKVNSKFLIEILFISVFSMLLAIYSMRLTFRDFFKIWQVGSDLKSNYIRAKVYQHSFNTSKLEELTTFPSDSVLFLNEPTADYFSRIIEFIFARITDNPILSTNLTLIFSFALTSGMAYFCLRSLKVNSFISFYISISISHLPYHLINVRYGFSNLNYSPIILTIYLIIILNIKKFDTKNVKNLSFLTLSALYISSTNNYYVYFSLVLFATSSLLLFVIGYEKNFYPKLLFSLFILMGVALQYIVDVKVFGHMPLSNLRTAGRGIVDYTGAGTHMWSFLAPTPFSDIQIIKVISNIVFQKFWPDYSITQNNLNYQSIYQSWLWAPDIEKISITPTLIVLTILLIILFLISTKFTTHAYTNQALKLNLWISISAFLLAINGLILSNLSILFPIFRSYSRANILVLISLLFFLAFFLNSLKGVTKSVIQSLVIITLFFDQINSNFSPRNYNFHLDTNHNNLTSIFKNNGLRKNKLLYAATLPVQIEEEFVDARELKIQTRLFIFYLYSDRLIMPMNIVQPSNKNFISKFEDLQKMKDRGLADFVGYAKEEGYDLILYDLTAYDAAENLDNLKILRSLSTEETDANYKGNLKVFWLKLS